MKIRAIEDATLEEVVRLARRQRVIMTRKGKPVALLVGLKGMDLEQAELSCSDKFWKLVKEWRQEPTISLKQLEAEMEEWDRPQDARPSRKRARNS